MPNQTYSSIPMARGAFAALIIYDLISRGGEPSNPFFLGERPDPYWWKLNDRGSVEVLDVDPLVTLAREYDTR